MAIDKVVVYQNTSVISDDILVHRLGLIPFNIDASLFETKNESDEFNSSNSIKFKLNVKCLKKQGIADITGLKRQDYLLNHFVFAE